MTPPEKITPFAVTLFLLFFPILDLYPIVYPWEPSIFPKGITLYTSFSAINFGDHPIDEFGDLKSGKYSYPDLATHYKKDLFNIERVNTSKISETIRGSISPTLYVGFIDFEITKNRFPRLC